MTKKALDTRIREYDESLRSLYIAVLALPCAPRHKAIHGHKKGHSKATFWFLQKSKKLRQQWCNHQTDNRHDVNQNIHRRTGGILQRITDGITHNHCGVYI